MRLELKFQIPASWSKFGQIAPISHEWANACGVVRSQCLLARDKYLLIKCHKQWMSSRSQKKQPNYQSNTTSHLQLIFNYAQQTVSGCVPCIVLHLLFGKHCQMSTHLLTLILNDSFPCNVPKATNTLIVQFLTKSRDSFLCFIQSGFIQLCEIVSVE